MFKTADNGYPQSKTKGTKNQWIGKQAYDIDSLKDEEVEKIYASKCPQVIINTFWPNSTFTFRPSQRRQTDKDSDAGEMSDPSTQANAGRNRVFVVL